MGNQVSAKKSALMVSSSSKNNTSKTANDIAVLNVKDHEEVPSGSSQILKPKGHLGSSLRKKSEKAPNNNFSRSKSLSLLAEDSRIEDTRSIYLRSEAKNSPRKPSTVSSASFLRGKTRSRLGSRRDPHPVSAQGREIIQACFENHHSEIGHRICMRVFEKRADYQKFIYALGKEKWSIITDDLRDFLDNAVRKVNDVPKIEEISRSYGEQHVEYKPYGFKPDFWVSLADAITLECVILDMASHQPTETVAAWSQFVSLMFTSVRDGYYAALRFQRRSSRRNKLPIRQQTVDLSSTYGGSPDYSDDRRATLATNEKPSGTDLVSTSLTRDRFGSYQSRRSQEQFDGSIESVQNPSSTRSVRSSTISLSSTSANSPISQANTMFY